MYFPTAQLSSHHTTDCYFLNKTKILCLVVKLAGGWMGIKPGLRDCLCAGQTTEIKGNEAITNFCVSNIGRDENISLMSTVDQ